MLRNSYLKFRHRSFPKVCRQLLCRFDPQFMVTNYAAMFFRIFQVLLHVSNNDPFCIKLFLEIFFGQGFFVHF